MIFQAFNLLPNSIAAFGSKVENFDILVDISEFLQRRQSVDRRDIGRLQKSAVICEKRDEIGFHVLSPCRFSWRTEYSLYGRKHITTIR